MCGIAGLHSGTDTLPNQGLLLAMAGELHHRGPDGVGMYLDAGFGMVSTRLSIIDLAGGDQPIGNEDGRYWVIQNGEIYNHPELRRELEASGHVFCTDCDTEVIVHAYEQWGEGCLDRFNGPFAFAIWDRRAQSLFLARDRYGVRPLFIARYGRDLLFGSEVKAILRHPGARRELDPISLIDSFTLWAPLPDRTAFLGIRELPPGHWLKIGPDGEVVERPWWDLRFEPLATQRRESEDDLAEELAHLLEDSTRFRLRADVPVAAYLSGGLDSSAIAALARRVSGERLLCFAIGFTDPRFDESSAQDRIARALGVELNRITITSREIAQLFPEVIGLAEKTILRTAPAPMLALASFVHGKGVKVVLTGEGADEIFAGYDLFRESQIRRFWARDPESLNRPRLFERIYPWLTRSATGAPGFTRQFFGQGLEETGDPLYSHRIRWGTTSRLHRFLDPGLLASVRPEDTPTERLFARLPKEFGSFSGLAKAQYLEIATFLHGYLLHSQGDRMMMGRSVEGRFPFLDHRIGEFAARLPDSMRLRGLRDKHILRKAVGPLLPPEIAQRPKRPYRAPILSAFVGTNAPDYVAELFEPSRVAETGVFNPRTVALLWDKCRQNAEVGVSEMDEMAFVGVLSTQLLHERMVRKPVLAPVPRANRVVINDRLLDGPELVGVS
jgi:asparagine synthase (glutamine-hydrolysing)